MKNVKMFSSAIAMLVFFATTAYSQADFFTISGTVSDQSGVLPGANVQVKNTNRITQTDIYGMYSIKAHKNEKLVFSFVGMAAQEVTVTKSAVVNIILNPENFLLQEVVQESRVVMGSLGIKRERSATSSSQIPVQGKASGLAVAHDKDHPRIVLRGNSSLQGGNQALIVIDNKIATAEQLKKLKPEEIQSTHVIKGAQGAALYGSDGVNGVITVTTKAAFAQGIQPYTPTQEDYESFVENPFESPKNAPLSTFSIDVDNASYTNIRRMINNGQKIPKDAVRVEEMVNFFKYDYPKPNGGHPFSINTEASDSPWNPKHKLLKIGLQGKILPTDDLPASNLVFLIDVSGSMNSANKLPLLVQSFKILLNELRTEDKVSIIVYAGAAGMVLPPTSGSEKQTIIAALDRLSAGGSTAGGAGIELAYKTAQENFIKGGNNRVILATDGDFNVGSTSNSDMQSLIETKRKSGVFLTCLGYGMANYKDSKMEILANKGNGNYAYIDNIQEANRFLSKEFKGSMFAIAKDVKIQIEFNPKHVQSYRLIGYENRKLRAEDFIDDSIDAGELGSGHTVTALYEIIPVGVESEFTKDIPELKYTENKTKSGNFNDELATIKFRYKKPDGEKSIEMIETIAHKFTSVQAASADLKFSAAVAWFGLKLRDSKLVGNKEVADIKNLAKAGIKNDPEGYRSEFIRLLETAI